MHFFISAIAASAIPLVVFHSTSATAFQLTLPIAKSRPSPTTTSLYDTTSEVDALLKQDYPIFYNLVMCKNATVWKELNNALEDPDKPNGFTIFAPNDEAMENLGKKRLDQLLDDRNREAAEKVAAYHAINEPVGAWDLITSGGIKTMGGDVKVGKSKVGGFMGWGGKEDGGVNVNGAKVLQTKQVDQCLVHEMDGIISPELVWRYMDQLRIL